MSKEKQSIEWHPIAVKALIINCLIFFLIVIARFNQQITFFGGIAIVLYLLILSFSNPLHAFLMTAGIKLTFDAFWFVKMPNLESIGLLELFLAPIIIIILLSIKAQKKKHADILFLALIYLIWVFLSTLLNGYFPDISLLMRQSGLLIGLVLGISYLLSKKHFIFTLYLIFISTMIPVLASTLQFLLSKAGIIILNFKLDTIRGVRHSGLYYDPATTGMVSLISVVTCFFLIQNKAISKKLNPVFFVFITMNCGIVLTGGTRSIIITFFLCVIIYTFINRQAAMKIAPFIVIVSIIFFPYIERTINRTASWELIQLRPNQKIKLQDAFQETEYRTLFAGRVGMWQDIWTRYKRGSEVQQIFGSGLTSNSHSSYLFLLLQIGWMGLGLYLILNVLLIIKLFTARITKLYKVIGLLSILLILLVGISATTVLYTSFQWIAYLTIGGVLNLKYQK